MTIAVVALAAFAIVFYSVREALVRTDRAAKAEVAQATAEGAAAGWQTTADTEGRMRRSETARADALAKELADDDQRKADGPADPDARGRVLSAWGVASRLATAEGGDEPGPVSDPAATEARPGDDQTTQRGTHNHD